MIFRMFVVIVLIIGAATITIAIFTENFPGVTERALEFIDIPEQDPTPQDIQGAERLRTVFESFSVANAAIQKAEASNQDKCYVKMSSVTGVKMGQSRITIEFHEANDAGTLNVIQGDGTQNDQVSVLESVQTELQPCIVAENLSQTVLGDSRNKKVLEDISPYSSGVIWNQRDNIARISDSPDDSPQTINSLPAGRAGSRTGSTGSNRQTVDADELGLKQYPFEKPRSMKHIAFKVDNHLCFFSSGDPSNSLTDPLRVTDHTGWEEAISEDYDKCEAGS